MSASPELMRPVKVVEPKIDITHSMKPVFAVLETGINSQFITVNPSGNPSLSQMTFSCNPPASTVFVGRRPLLACEFLLTFAGTTTLAPLLQCNEMNALPGVQTGVRQLDALRCDPLNSAISNLSVALNSDRVSVPLCQYSRISQRFGSWKEDAKTAQSPNYADPSMSYSDLTTSPRSPLLGYASSTEGYEGRAGGSYSVLETNTATSATVRVRVASFLNISPFSFENIAGAEPTNLIGVQSCDVIVSMAGRNGIANALWSHNTDSSAVFSNIAVSLVSASLTFQYTTPPIQMAIPQSLSYDYSDIAVYPTVSSLFLAPGAQATIPMNTVVLNSIPSKMYIWASYSDATADITKTDCYFRIDGLDLSFGNQSGILASANSRDLYQISVENGLNSSFSQWDKHTGSVLALSVGENLQLPPGQAVGLRGSFTMRMAVRCTNLFPTAEVPTLWVVCVSDGVMQIINMSNGSPGTVLRSIGVLTPADIMTAFDSKEVVPYFRPTSLMGGRLQGGKIDWGKVWRWAKGALKTVGNVATAVAPIIAPEFAAPIATANRFIQGASLIGGSPAIGGRAMGGQSPALTRAQLRRMLAQ
jgi:hypothetical protein